MSLMIAAKANQATGRPRWGASVQPFPRSANIHQVRDPIRRLTVGRVSQKSRPSLSLSPYISGDLANSDQLDR